MTATSKQVLIAGATGVVGYAAMQHFASSGIATRALSRRVPDATYGAVHATVDLNDPAATRDFAETCSGVTHLVYAALFEKPGLVGGWLQDDQIATNDRMLRNLLEPLMAAAVNLEHVTLLQGTKAYGAHVRPIDLPARENRSEHAHDNFYWLQEQYLRSAAEQSDWRWTIFRPQIIFGETLGVAMNLIPVLGAYGALLKARGEPLHFPGGPGGVLEAVDADLLAHAIAWAGGLATDATRGSESRQHENNGHPAANEIFNITNGDVFNWRSLWPMVADALGMAVGEDRPLSVAAMLSSADAEWRALAAQHGLREPDLQQLVGESHHYADFTMAYGFAGAAPPPALVSTIKLRAAGFHEVIDTEVMFRKWFRRLQDNRVLPPP